MHLFKNRKKLSVVGPEKRKKKARGRNRFVRLFTFSAARTRISRVHGRHLVFYAAMERAFGCMYRACYLNLDK